MKIVQNKFFEIIEIQGKPSNYSNTAEKINVIYDCLLVKLLKRSKKKHKIDWRTFLIVLNGTDVLIELTSDFFYEKAHLLSSDFLPEVKRCFNLTLQYYLMKHFMPFLREMGGWDDLENFYNLYSNTSKTTSKFKICCVLSIVALSILKFY